MKRGRETTSIAVAAIVVSMTLTGCGGGGHSENTAHPTTPTTSGTSSRDELGQKYLEIVAPGNQAIETFKQKTDAYSDSTTADQVAADAAPVVSAIDEVDNALLRVDWPATIATDVKALVTADGALKGDLNSVGSLNALSISAWSASSHKTPVEKAQLQNIVRADLGLTPVSQ